MGKSCYVISLPTSSALLHTDASCRDIKVGRKAYGQKDILSLQVKPWVAVNLLSEQGTKVPQISETIRSNICLINPCEGLCVVLGA